jgi:predicted nucleic acid-binding protein
VKISVTYSELRSRNYDHRRAEASVELEVHERDLEEAYETAWAIVKEQVRRQLTDDVDRSKYDRLQQLATDEVPF